MGLMTHPERPEIAGLKQGRPRASSRCFTRSPPGVVRSALRMAKGNGSWLAAAAIRCSSLAVRPLCWPGTLDDPGARRVMTLACASRRFLGLIGVFF